MRWPQCKTKKEKNSWILSSAAGQFQNSPSHCLTAVFWQVEQLDSFFFKSNIYLLCRNSLKINSFACHVKCKKSWETDLSHGSAKGSYGAASMLSRRKCLVVSIDFKFLALSLLREHIREEKKGLQVLASLSELQWKTLCSPQAKLLQIAFMSLTACQVLNLATLLSVYAELLISQIWLSSKTGWSTWPHRCSPYIMFHLIIEF